MKITKKNLQILIEEELIKLMQEKAGKNVNIGLSPAGVFDAVNKESRPTMSKEKIRNASMKELEEEWRDYGCKDVAMSSSEGEIEYCSVLDAAYVARAKAEGMSVESLYTKYNQD